jgi:hypothetical protein
VLNRLLKNKKIKYLFAGLAGCVLFFAVFNFLAYGATQNNPSSLKQYGVSTSTSIVNGSWVTNNIVNLQATSSNSSGYPYVMYYQLLSSASSFITVTTTPASFCQTKTSYSSCSGSNYVWANATTTSGWYDKKYPYRTMIAVQYGKVTAAQTNFPVYVNLARMGAANTFWSHLKKKSDGGDILITNSAGTRLPVEVVSVSTSSKTGEIYFKADSLSNTVNTNFYIYYGSSTAAQPASSTTYGSRNVWSNGYAAVWHFAGSLRDSTWHSLSTTTSGAVATTSSSMLGNTSEYFKSSIKAHINYGNPTALSISGNNPFTMESWVRFSTLAASSQVVLSKGDFQYNMQKSSANPGVITSVMYDTNYHVASSSTNLAINTWYFFAGTYTGAVAGPNTIYFNGVGQASTSIDHINNTTANFWVGGNSGASQPLNGMVDEVRISSSTRSKYWIGTEYNNMKSPGTFYSTSSEQYYLTTSKKAENIPGLPDSVSPAGYKWQVLACDFNNTCSKNWIASGTVPNFKVDVTAPSQPNLLTKMATTSTAFKLGMPAAVTETNFSQYKIFYRQGSTTPIHETDSVWNSTNYPDLASKNFSGKVNASTTITGLTPNTTYSFTLWAYDLAGNDSSSTLVWGKTQQTPPSITGMNTCATGGDRDSACGSNASPEYTTGNTDGLIYLVGTNFGTAGTVKFTGNFGSISGTVHGVAEGACTVAGWTNTSVCVEVSPSISSSTYDGTVTLTRTIDSQTAAIGLHIQPRITYNSPVTGSPGDTIAINGDHFCQYNSTCPTTLPDTNSNFIAYFGTTQVSLSTDFVTTCSGGKKWSDSQVCVKVPAGIAAGTQNTKIQGQLSALYESERTAFTVLSPTPATPTNIKQSRNSGFTNQIPVSGYASVTPVYFSLDTSDSVSGGMVYPQFEIRPVSGVNSTFVSTCAAGTYCVQGTGASYTNGTQTLTVSTTTSDNLYHWQSRVRYTKNSLDYYSAWQSFPISGNAETVADFILDTTAPVITTPPSAAPTNVSAVITWVTNELATSQVQYDKTSTACSSYSFNASCATSNDCSTLDPTLVSSHTVNLTSLTSNSSAYCYRVRTKDAANNETVSANFGFTTIPVTPAAGQLTSVIFDTTQSSTVLPTYNSIMWEGSSGGSQGRVRFQLATSNNTAGPWNYFGSSDNGVTCNSSSWYDPGATDTPAEISCAPAYHNNQRYYRYKVQICATSNCSTVGSSSPIVNDVIINWAP